MKAKKQFFRCQACGKNIRYTLDKERNHMATCEELKRLRSLAKRPPSMVRVMTEEELKKIEDQQEGRHCMAGCSGSYYLRTPRLTDFITGA